MGHIQTSRLVPGHRGEVYSHLADLTQLPHWLAGQFEVELSEAPQPLHEQMEFILTLRRRGLQTHLRLRVEELRPGERITYRQVRGVFRSWTHTQILTSHDDETSLVTDLVDFRLPHGVLGALVDDLLVRRQVKAVLENRLLRIEETFAHRRHKPFEPAT